MSDRNKSYGKTHLNSNTFPSSAQLPKTPHHHIFEDEGFDTAYLNPRYRDMALEMLETPIPPYLRLELPRQHRNAKTAKDLGLDLKLMAGVAWMVDTQPEVLINTLVVGIMNGGVE